MRRRTVYAFMGLHVAGSAITYVLGKRSAVGFQSPAALAMLRAAGAAALLVALTGWAIPRPRFTRREWTQVAALGLLLMLNQYLFLLGLRDTVPAHPPLIYAMTPLGVLVLQHALSRTPPTVIKTFAVALAFTGVLVLLRPWEEGPRLAEIRTGDLWIVVGMVVWVVYTVAATPLFRRHDPRVVTTWTLAIGALAFLPIGVPAVLGTDLAAIPADAWAGVAWLAVVTSAVMMLLWNGMLRHLEPVEVAVCSNAQPAATAGLVALLAATGVLASDQDLGLLYWLGTALVVAGVLLAQVRRSRAR